MLKRKEIKSRNLLNEKRFRGIVEQKMKTRYPVKFLICKVLKWYISSSSSVTKRKAYKNTFNKNKLISLSLYYRIAYSYSYNHCNHRTIETIELTKDL